MKLVAGAVLVLAAVHLAQPFVVRAAEQRENKELAAKCWSSDALISAGKIAKQRLTEDIMDEIQRSSPGSKTTDAIVSSRLKIDVKSGGVEGINPAIRSSECTAQYVVQYLGVTSTVWANFRVMPSESGEVVTIAGRDLLSIWNTFYKDFGKAPQPK